MRLEVRDPVVVGIGRRTAVGAAGVARLHEAAWLPGALVRRRGGGVEVARRGDDVVVTVRLVVLRGATVIDVLREVQRSVRDRVEHLTGLAADVVVVVVDLA